MCLSFTFNANVVKASDAYTEQTAIVHVYSEDNIQPLQIRFYKGFSAPYIKLTDYYRYLTGKEMSVQKMPSMAIAVPFGTPHTVETHLLVLTKSSSTWAPPTR